MPDREKDCVDDVAIAGSGPGGGSGQDKGAVGFSFHRQIGRVITLQPQ